MNLIKTLPLALALAAAGCASKPEMPPAAYGSTQTLAVGQTVRYDDGLSLELERIEDSRCQQGQQCVWAGELAPIIEVRGGLSGDKATELRLATGSAPRKQLGRYSFVLRQATAGSATVTLTRQ